MRLAQGPFAGVGLGTSFSTLCIAATAVSKGDMRLSGSPCAFGPVLGTGVTATIVLGVADGLGAAAGFGAAAAAREASSNAANGIIFNSGLLWVTNSKC